VEAAVMSLRWHAPGRRGVATTTTPTPTTETTPFRGLGALRDSERAKAARAAQRAGWQGKAKREQGQQGRCLSRRRHHHHNNNRSS